MSTGAPTFFTIARTCSTSSATVHGGADPRVLLQVQAVLPAMKADDAKALR